MPVATTPIVWHEALTAYHLGSDHPFDPRRLELTVSLIRAVLREMGADGAGAGGPAPSSDTPSFDPSSSTSRSPASREPDTAAAGAPGASAADPPGLFVAPRPATDEELALAHAPEYVAAVRAASLPHPDLEEARRWGLGTEDTPVAEGIHDAAALVVGATLRAAELVMTGRARRAFNPGGGLHHAMADKASGFCVYNDLAVAIRWIQREHGARVMYIDYDAHHGDGVQQIFYDDPDVLTVSFHESGLYLYPGTGFIEELGTGDGFGYSVNVPLMPGTGDASWREAFRFLVPELAGAFRPDVIVLQNGCDGHVLDPLAHLRATTGLFEDFVKLVCEVADEYCEGRVVATGGGGYSPYLVVPRAWTLVWGALAGLELPDRIPGDWLAAARAESGLEIPSTLRDPPDAFPPSPDRERIEAANEKTARGVRARVMPHITGWGLAF